MSNSLLGVLACPHCKTPLSVSPRGDRDGLDPRSGNLICTTCNCGVGVLRFGKADFIRYETVNASTRTSPDPATENALSSFSYKRMPWNSSGIVTRGLAERHLGWTPEGYGGALFSDGANPWELAIETDASDVDLRIETGPESGMVDVFLDGLFLKKLFLRKPGQKEIAAYSVFRSRPVGHVSRIVLRPPSFGDHLGKPDHFCFSGYDAAFPQHELPPRIQLNRGNRYPDTYAWAINLLPPDGLALDCGSGDRTFGDPRVISFEYLPFELPDVFGDGHALPFCDDTFDIVFSQAVIEHMSDPFLAAREIARVLKPGGLLYAESAFMQPLHAVPFHFFNTTPWGIKEIFFRAGLTAINVEWFGALSGSVKWYLDVCDMTNKLPPDEIATLLALLGKADAMLSYQELKTVASAVAIWAVKPGPAFWADALVHESRPTYAY